jgi:hypothetical protein
MIEDKLPLIMAKKAFVKKTVNVNENKVFAQRIAEISV